MSNKIKTAACSFILVVLILAATFFNSAESKVSEPAAAGVLSIIVYNVYMTPGTYAFAQNASGQYPARIIGSNRVIFPPMPAGSYIVTICASTTAGPHNYFKAGFQYNGGEQNNWADLIRGACNPE